MGSVEGSFIARSPAADQLRIGRQQRKQPGEVVAGDRLLAGGPAVHPVPGLAPAPGRLHRRRCGGPRRWLIGHGDDRLAPGRNPDGHRLGPFGQLPSRTRSVMAAPLTGPVRMDHVAAQDRLRVAPQKVVHDITRAIALYLVDSGQIPSSPLERDASGVLPRKVTRQACRIDGHHV